MDCMLLLCLIDIDTWQVPRQHGCWHARLPSFNEQRHQTLCQTNILFSYNCNSDQLHSHTRQQLCWRVDLWSNGMHACTNKIPVLHKSPHQHSCWHTQLPSTHRDIKRYIRRILSCLIIIMLINCTAMHASNHAGAWTCEVMDCMLLHSQSISWVHKSPRRHGCWHTCLLSIHKDISAYVRTILCWLILIMLITCTAICVPGGVLARGVVM
jgi:hypothetical protein